MYYKIVDSSIPNGQKHSSFNINLKVVLIALLVLLPLTIYLISLITNTGQKQPLEANFIVKPEEITKTEESKGIHSKNFTKVFISYKNNTDKDIKNLKVFIPKAVINDAGAGVKGFTDRKVGIDFAAARKSGKKHIVLIVPDIRAGNKQQVELVSFYSQKTGVFEIQGELRTDSGLNIIANSASVVVK
jgi:hypothetical protein